MRGATARGDLIGVIVAVVALAILALVSREPASRGLDTFASDDVRSGGYAAWSTLLEREGVRAEPFERRAIELDPQLDTLIAAEPLVYDPASWAPADVAAAADWVRGGGRLILIGGDPLVAGAERTSLLRPRTRLARATGGPLAGPLSGAVMQLAALGPTRFVPRRGQTVLLSDRGGAIALRQPLGRGAVVFVSNPEPFTNANLGRADDARFAFLLAQPRRAGASVAFDEAIHGALVDRRWWNVLSVPQRIALCGTLAALLFAGIAGALRLGPPVRLLPPREPTSAEFVAAVAALYGRTHARAHVITNLARVMLPAHVGPASAAERALRDLAARGAPDDRDVIAGAVLAHTIREERRR
jgi:hypothetical protein